MTLQKFREMCGNLRTSGYEIGQQEFLDQQFSAGDGDDDAWKLIARLNRAPKVDPATAREQAEIDEIERLTGRRFTPQAFRLGDAIAKEVPSGPRRPNYLT